MKGPAARTVVLVLPQITPPALVLPSASSASSAGFLAGMQLPKLLDADCVEGLLGYARLLFSQRQGGKLSVLGVAGNKMHTITSWDPGQQALDSIIKGFSKWKVSELETSSPDLQLAISDAVKMLFQPPGIHIIDDKSPTKNNHVGEAQDGGSPPSKFSTSEPWNVAHVSRTRIVVIMAQNWGAGGSAELYHRMVLDSIPKIDMRANDLECEMFFLDVSSKDKISNSCVCMEGSESAVHLSTSYYKLQPACTADLLLDLAYLHLELSAIAVKSPTTLVLKHQVDKGVKHEDDEGSLEHNVASDTDLRLVLCQTSPMALPGRCCFTPNGGELRKSRTSFLLRLKKLIPKSQLLSLPCTSVTPALLEAPFSRSAAQIWESVRAEEVDAEGDVVLALSSDRESMSISHLLVCHLERFWMHTLKLRDGRDNLSLDSSKGDTLVKLEELADDKKTIRFQEGQGPAMPGKVTDEKTPVSKKRALEELDDPANQVCSPNFSARDKKGCKPPERPMRCYPVTSSETIIGGPDRHSASLAALLAPIRGVFVSEDPPSELVSTATKCVARLLELTEKNDASLFPHTAEIPVARRDLYKKMWWELKRLAKRTRKDKTQGQEDLAQAIRAARADFKTSEQQLPQPLPALTEKPAEHVHINKRRRCEEVPRDVHGRPIFPIKLGPSLQVYDLGNVVWNRPAFHSEKYIWPAGYKSRRAYASMLNSENRIFYWCEIADDGQAPEFRLTPEDDENNPVIGISATAVWTVVVKRVGALRLEEGGKKTFANVSGPEYFGFANPTIARLIQQLPNSEKCTKYKRQDYFPNVPMRATELDAWQGTLANETSSPQKKEGVPAEGKELERQGTHGQGGDQEMAEAEERTDQGGATSVPEEDKERVRQPVNGTSENELRGMSWGSEEFRKAASRTGKLGLAEFSEHFLASNAGSLFSYYWSSKLKRAMEGVELDGRK